LFHSVLFYSVLSISFLFSAPFRLELKKLLEKQKFKFRLGQKVRFSPSLPFPFLFFSFLSFPFFLSFFLSLFLPSFLSSILILSSLSILYLKRIDDKRKNPIKWQYR